MIAAQTILGFLVSRAGIATLLVLLVLGGIGVQEARIKIAQHGEARARADLLTANAGWTTCRASLKAQTAAVDAQSSRSAAALAEAEKQLAAAAPKAAHYARQSAALAAYKPKGSDRCELLEDAVDQARRMFQ